jgi:hypothetical protein
VKSFETQTHYEVLEISVGASTEEIRRAWERLNHLYSEEQVALYGLVDPARAEMLRRRLKQALDVLTDEAQRDAYDVSLGLPPRERPGSGLATAAGETPAMVSIGWGQGIAWVTPAPTAEGRAQEFAVSISAPVAPRGLAWAEPPRPSAPPVGAQRESPKVEAGPKTSSSSMRWTLPAPEASAAEATVDAGRVATATSKAVRAEEATLAERAAHAEAVSGEAVEPKPHSEESASGPTGVCGAVDASVEVKPAAAATSAEEPLLGAPSGAAVAKPDTTAAPRADIAGAASEGTRLSPSVLEAAPGRFEAPAAEMRSAATHPESSTAGERSRPEAPAPENLGTPGGDETAVANGDSGAIVPAKPTPVREYRPEPRPKPYEVPAGVEFNGDLLRQVRMARGLSLLQLSERTRISLRHLENVESDRYESLPAPVYLRGILMSLARELGLDGLRVSKSYLAFVEARRAKG